MSAPSTLSRSSSDEELPITPPALETVVDESQLTGTTRFEPLPGIKNIMITGGAGFIGSWATRHFAKQYQDVYNIVCYDKLDIVASTNNITALEELPNFTFIQGDITDFKAVLSVYQTYQIDAIIHFAASTHVQHSFTQPFSFTTNNVVGTQVLLEAARTHGQIKRFVHVSTDEVYGESHGAFATEDTELKPTNPYSASKAAAEMYVNAYRKSFNIPSLIVRSNNFYGPCQYPEKIIPTFVKLLMKHQPLTIQGDGSNTRRYLFGEDAANAFDTLFHKGEVGEVYNIESDEEVENLEVAKKILERFGYEDENLEQADSGRRVKMNSKYLNWIPDRPFNDAEYRVDGSKLMGLGWRQNVGFEDGLNDTVDWYRRNGGWWWNTSYKGQKPSRPIPPIMSRSSYKVDQVTKLPSDAEIRDFAAPTKVEPTMAEPVIVQT